jgi:O-antigen/teichoic acid export membrane protein
VVSTMLKHATFRSTFISNTLVNAAGIAGGQLIILLATPVLARRYTPAEFGIYASAVAVCSVIATGAGLRFDIALPAASDDETATIYRFGLLACVCSLLIGALGVAQGIHHIVPWPQVLLEPSLALLTIVAGAVQGLLYIFSAALIRQGSFVHTAFLRIIQPAGFVAVALLTMSGGLPVALASGLLIAAVLGFVFSSSYLFRPAGQGLRQTARKYWEYPLISLPTALLDTLALSMPLLFIVQHYGAQAGGNYSQVQRLIAAPLLLCSVAIAQVFYKHAGDAVRSGQSPRPLLWKTVRALSLAGVAGIVIAALLGEPVLSLFLGPGWRTDARYLLLILIPAVVRASVSPVTSVFLIAQQLKFGAVWQVAYAGTTWLVLTFASSRLPLDGLLIAILVSELTMYALYLWMADIAVCRLERKSIECAA